MNIPEGWLETGSYILLAGSISVYKLYSRKHFKGGRQESTNRMLEGMTWGVCGGVVISLVTQIPMLYLISIGMAAGLLVGYFIRKK